MPRPHLFLLCVAAVAALGAVLVPAAEPKLPDIDPEYEKVSCGSTIKLTQLSTGFKLHSHGVAYGSGSGQQSVTGFVDRDDPNSFWKIKAEFGKQCTRGEPVPCGNVVRLQHVNTGRHLHSHLHQSPLSGQQEVSAFDGANDDDNWKVLCQNSGDKFWKREAPVTLFHTTTDLYLVASSRHVYRHPIPGQLEVSATKHAGRDGVWAAQEGFYFAAGTSQ